MRASILILLSILACLAVAAAAQPADHAQAPNTIAVIGSASADLPADEIVWHIDLRTENPDLAEAKAENDAKLAILRRGAAGLGLGDEDLDVGRVAIERVMDHDERGQVEGFKHFELRRSVTMRQRNAEGSDAFLDAVIVPAGLAASVSWVASGRDAACDSLRVAAMADARTQAAALAAGAGARLGRVYTLSDYPVDNGQRMGGNMHGNQARDGLGAGSKPLVRVWVQVFASFLLEGEDGAAGER